MYIPLILSIDVIGFEVAICRLLLLLIFLEVRVILSPSKKKSENNVFLKDTYDFICKEKRCMQNHYPVIIIYPIYKKFTQTNFVVYLYTMQKIPSFLFTYIHEKKLCSILKLWLAKLIWIFFTREIEHK